MRLLEPMLNDALLQLTGGEQLDIQRIGLRRFKANALQRARRLTMGISIGRCKLSVFLPLNCR